MRVYSTTPRPGIAMSIAVMTRVWAGSRHKGSALLLMLALADFAHDDGTNAYPSIATLAAKTRMSTRQVQRVIHQCERSGELLADRSTDGLHSTRYTLVLTALNTRGGNMSPLANPAWSATAGVTRTVKEPSEAITTKEEAERIWAAALEQLRGYPATTRNMLAELPVSLDGAVLVVRCPPEIAAQWGPYVKRALGGRAVRFVSG